MDMIDYYIAMNTNDSDADDSSSNNYVNDSMVVQDQIVVSRPPSRTLEQALITFAPNTITNTVQQQRTENDHESVNPLNIFSRVSIFYGKYPSDATLRNYADLQAWMYIHGNKHAPVDLCESLTRMFLRSPGDYGKETLFNIYLICTEAYQTVGNVSQAYYQYNEARAIAATLDNRRMIMNLYEISERDRKRKKLDDIGMKLTFQAQFESNLIEEQTRQRFNLRQNHSHDGFPQQLNIDNPSPEKCRLILRQISLQSILNPSMAIPGAELLLSYAYRFPTNTLQHANSLYVALNLFLFGYGSKIFRERLDIDVFKILDDIACYFEENGNQSKQFSPVHKMAHVWGTAAVAFHLASDEYKYLVCASMVRVSFESLGISFLSSGIESLYILARKHTPEFFTMMGYDPRIKLISPDCINYFRRKLENNDTAIRYSNKIVDQFVSEAFNIDQTDRRI